MTLVAGLLAVLGSTALAEEKRMERTVTVTASGTITAIPDMARISTGVVAEAETARAALTGNSEMMAKLIAGLKSSGIDPKDIQTSSFHIEPRYTNPREGEVAVINGYRVVNQVEVTSRNLDKLGEVMDALVSLGANQMNGLAFDVSKAEMLRDDARKDAIANARRRAELYAAAAGAKVGKVVLISEDTAPGPQPFLRGARAQMAAASVPLERGSETLEARVTVTWELE
jgi:uncharacterized protein